MADDINISPEMINNLVNMIRNNTSNLNNNSETSGNDNNISEKSNNSDNNTNNTTNSNNSKTDNSSVSANNIDFETIMKLKSIMDTLNYKDGPDSNLLYSLKPYLRKSRQEKLDQYVNIIKISRISKLFKQ